MDMKLRVATPRDLPSIYSSLFTFKRLVWVREVSQPLKGLYLLSDVRNPPFLLTSEGLHAVSLDGTPTMLRITEQSASPGDFPHTVELRKGEGKWYSPDIFGSVMLLVPDLG